MKAWEKRLRIAKAYGASPSTYAKVREEVMENDKRYTAGAVWDLHGDTVLLVSSWVNEDGKEPQQVLKNVILNFGAPSLFSELNLMEMGMLEGDLLIEELRVEGTYHFHFGDD